MLSLEHFLDLSMKEKIKHCCYCNCELDDKNRSRDHVIPRSAGIKLQNANNIVASCKNCNNKKGSKTLLTFVGIINTKIVIDSKCNHLAQISGLNVRKVEERNETCYIFSLKKRDITSLFTYQKAKAFANGVSVGKRLTKMGV